MKKQIFIAIHYLELGGAENALIGLLHAIDYSRYDVSLFVHAHRGEMMRYIPPQIRLLPELPAWSVIESPLTDAIRKGRIGVALGRIIARFRHRHYLSKCRQNSEADNSVFSYVADSVCPFLPEMDSRTYDLAISFLTPHNYVLSKVKARKKICWIHTDYSRISVNTDLELPVWEAFDRIISISPRVTEAFLETFPTLGDRITEIANILPADIIRNLAEETPDDIDSPNRTDQSNDSPKPLRLLSIGRFSHAKNFDNIPDIARRLRDCHNIHPFRWDIIGYGGDEELIRNKIAEAGVEDCVFILGKRSNPYPYIKSCDIYVQPSRYEGRCVTVQEARLLGRPVVTSDYPTAVSQVENGVDGIILPLENDAFSKGLAELILDKGLLDRITINISRRDYSDREEINKLYSLIP